MYIYYGGVQPWKRKAKDAMVSCPIGARKHYELFLDDRINDRAMQTLTVEKKVMQRLKRDSSQSM